MRLISYRLGTVFMGIYLIVFFNFYSAEGAEWKHFGGTVEGGNEESVFYDTQTLENTSKGVIRVWVKITKTSDLIEIGKEKEKRLDEEFVNILTEKMRKENIKDNDKVLELLAEKMMETAANYIKAHKKILYEIKCKEKMIRVISAISYNDKLEPIGSFSNYAASWTYIVPESILSFLYKELCKE